MQRIGRYEIAGHLATGGMAEILLGRLVGPEGFERPVVIKCILPHLAREDSFVRMFLDEARIAARIRHPNVVQVTELLHEEGRLCLVMEYLEGESLAGLMRRLAVRERRLEPALAAHVIAMASAGLHAAHELADEDGRHLALVHRDVSPQNLFVGYDGSVRVLDFGIAVMRDRTTKTRTGTLRGKYEYMSPEQCAARPLDRRSDVFSLGVVLYELSTGVRVFRRRHELLTLKAITEEKLVLPSTLRPDYPRSLERVVLNALERKRTDRYQTAAELRRDLLAVARQLDPSVVLDEALAALMRELFPDRIEQKRELLRMLRSGTSLPALPAAEVDAEVELPTVSAQFLGPAEATHPSAAHRPGRAGLRLRGLVVVALAVAAVLGVAITMGWPRGVQRQVASGTALATALPPPAATPTPPPSVAAAPTPARVTVRIESEPPGAAILIAGVPRGTTPGAVSLPQGLGGIEVVLRRPGYRELTERVVPDVDQRLRLMLVPIGPGPRQRASAPAPPTPAYHRFD